MCAVIGALIWHHESADRYLNQVYLRSHARGRDGRGVVRYAPGWQDPYEYRETSRLKGTPRPLVFPLNPFNPLTDNTSVTLINLRAEPTTEYVKDKQPEDQQPYTLGNWSIVHNGTIANDKELRNDGSGMTLTTAIDSAAIVERLVRNDVRTDHFETFYRTVSELKGSFAILAANRREPGSIYIAVNYRPVWYAETDSGVFFASARDYLPGVNAQMIEPYTVCRFERDGGQLTFVARPLERKRAPGPTRALVVCSGGLDSVVAATVAQRQLRYEVTLCHFLYGSRAQLPEAEAIVKVAEALGVPYLFLRFGDLYDEGDSPLLDHKSKFAGGEAGAEFAHEWVPARNLVMLAMATAYAEAKSFDKIVLGNNLEEAGAYPDNEPEFINRFNDMLPFAVADGKRVIVEMPVGNLMKHEIVARGHEVGAPLHLTWSCYRAGEKHCGQCGPCYMRRTAFEINGIPEVIDYVSDN